VSRIQIFDHFGTKIDEVQADADRTWKISDYGRCQFILSTYDDKCTEENLEYGNYVYIDHDTLPAWGGIIYTPREWGKHTVTVTAYSGEFIFKLRRAEAITTETASPGNLFSIILDKANAEGDTRIKEGDIYTDGATLRWKLNVLKFYDEIKRLSDETKNEWRLRAKLSNGQIRFLADWSKKLGIVRNYELKETHNIETNDRIIIEQGDIANDVLGIGNGATQISKTNIVRIDDTSLGKYGLMQFARTFQQGEYGSVEVGTESTLEDMKEPSKVFSLSVLDVGDTWDNVDLGDTLKLYMSNIGFRKGTLGINTDVRITGMTYLENEGKLELVCEEVK
jgi:hypothetical protein